MKKGLGLEKRIVGSFRKEIREKTQERVQEATNLLFLLRAAKVSFKSPKCDANTRDLWE